MKLKPLYMYGIIFVIIIAGIIVTSTNSNEKMSVTSNPMGDANMPNDAVHQGMNGMPGDALHQGMGGDAPSKNNIRDDFWEKLKKFEADLKANPNDTLLMKNYAQMLGMSHQTEKAIELYEKILKIDPNRVDILLAEGLAFYNDQNFQMAEVVTKRIIARDKNNIEAQYNLGVIAASQGKDEDAKKIWKEISEKYPNDEVGQLAGRSLKQISEQ
jgi:tetratricopeptide (TPR) repeat protein